MDPLQSNSTPFIEGEESNRRASILMNPLSKIIIAILLNANSLSKEEGRFTRRFTKTLT